ncbi:uncharacterized protein JCM6883_002311 [Sporobolomyces salmoneus]|uniref:uncharacterized protein n=1 Tax=Sporobolomyces salmoneus TaxID=183962 RepID=UPI0031819D7F
MSAAALKAEANDLFARGEWQSAAQSYLKALALVEESDLVTKTSLLSNRSACFIKLSEFDKAIVDANLCIKIRPNWSRGFARRGEAYSAKQNFGLACFAYSEAIRNAEDKAAKSRYVATLQTVKQKRQRQPETSSVSSAARALSRSYGRNGHKKYLDAKQSGYEAKRGGGVEMMIFAWEAAEKAYVTLFRAIDAPIDTLLENGRPRSSLLFSVCILLDHTAFAVPRNLGNRYKDKFNALMTCESEDFDVTKYLDGRHWNGEEIIVDLIEQGENREVWENPQGLHESFTEQTRSVLLCFIQSTGRKLTGTIRLVSAEAMELLELAIELIDESNRVWSGIPFSEKGITFSSAFRRWITVEALHDRVEGNQIAEDESAKAAFSLESIESAARSIIKENPQGKWRNADEISAREVHWSRLGFYVMPTVRANLALGYCSAQRARAPPVSLNAKADSVGTADLVDARKAARYYDLAYQLLPDDHYRKPDIVVTLARHLLAGGKTIRQFLERAKEISDVLQELLPIFSELEEEEEEEEGPARAFVNRKADYLMTWLESPKAESRNGVAPLDLVLKPVPIVNVVTTTTKQETLDEHELLTDAFWASLPGDVPLSAEVLQVGNATS